MSFINNAINAFFNVDVVGIFDQESGDQIFSGAAIVKNEVMRDSKIFEHPLETGAVRADHKITLPNEIRMQIIIAGKKYPEVYKKMVQAFENATMLDIKAKVDFFSNMIIKAMPHSESADMLDAVAMNIHFREVRLVSLTVTEFRANNVGNPVQSSTQPTGEKNPKRSASFLFRRTARRSG